jgi:phospholipid/cholesterol/gamma-HCH transport system substrate-binding protein
MLIREDARQFIHEDALAAVGTDGLMGNKLVSINAVKQSKAKPVEDGDTLQTLSPIETDEMIRTLNTTNDNIKYISADLRTITQKINSRNTLWSLLMDTVVAENVKQALVKIRITGERSATITGDLSSLVQQAKQGKGLVGTLLTDSTLSNKLNSTFVRLDSVSSRMATVTGDFKNVTNRINKGEGTVGMLVMDTVFVKDLKSAIKNANQGAEGFSENMEALKHSVFLRKYFKNKTKAKK